MIDCPKCGEAKPATDFRQDGRIGSGCTPCRAAYRRERYQARRDEIRRLQAEYRRQSRDRINAQQNESYWADPERARAKRSAWHHENRDAANERRREVAKTKTPEQKAIEKARAYEWRYNMTLAERDAMLATQGGKCAICAATEPGGRGEWCTDHDHACCPTRSKSCGKCARGILCFACNVMLGCAKDRPEVLTAGVAYLEASNVSRMQPI